MHFPLQIPAEAIFYLDLYYKISRTRNSTHDINYSTISDIRDMYDLNNDEYLLLTDIVDIGESVYMEKLSNDMGNKTK